jgi:hypothetical protein
MRRFLFVAAAAAALAGCKPAQVALSVEPGFYPSAVAHDPADDRFFIASHATGEIAIVRRDGSRIGTVPARGASTSTPALQLSYEPRARRLWTLAPEGVELIELAGAPARRSAIARPAPGGRFADLVADGEGRAFVLDAARREVTAVDARGGAARVVARLPSAPQDARALPAGPHCAGTEAYDEGALALMPDRSLLAAADGALWRIDLPTGAIDEVRLAAPLTNVSQLVPLGGNAVAALRGRANEVITLRLARDARRAVVDAGTRARFDTPLRGVHDGRDLVLLLGRLRHHPDFCGDGRPNLPARLAAYAPGAAGDGLAIARR